MTEGSPDQMVCMVCYSIDILPIERLSKVQICLPKGKFRQNTCFFSSKYVCTIHQVLATYMPTALKYF